MKDESINKYLKNHARSLRAEVYESDTGGMTIRFGFNFGGLFGCNLIVEPSGNMYIPEYFLNNATPESLDVAKEFIEAHQQNIAYNKADYLYRATQSLTAKLYGELGHSWASSQEYYFGNVLVIVTPDRVMLMEHTYLISEDKLGYENAKNFVSEVRSEYC